MTRAGWWTSAALVALLVGNVPAYAANARLERVILLPSADRSSVVLELTTEPRQISTRRISDSVFEVEAGPGIDSIPQVLKAPSNVRFIESVSVRVMPTDQGSVVRARITLRTSATTVVRSAGRRVYVDVSAAPPTTPVPQMPAVRAAAATAPAPAAKPTADEGYRSAVRPLVEKLKELGPFLASAATGDAGVTAAILPNLSTVRASLASLQPPEAEQGSHTMVLGAIDRVIRALAPDFAGDRAAAVRQSMTTIEVVGGVLAGE